MRTLLSDRLMALLRLEIAAFEAVSREAKRTVLSEKAAGCEAASTGGGEEKGQGEARRLPSRSQGAAGNGRKERIDILSQLTRTLEKLIDLKRLEMLANRGGAEDDAQTLRLRDELVARLKALDARRRGEGRLFAGPDQAAAPGIEEPVEPNGGGSGLERADDEVADDDGQFAGQRPDEAEAAGSA